MEHFNLKSMECRRSPLSYLLILTKEVLYSTTSFVEFKGGFDFENFSNSPVPRYLHKVLNRILDFDFSRFNFTYTVRDENLLDHFTEFPLRI